MQLPPPRNDKSNNRRKPRPTLAGRINRAADDLNPFLILVAVGLLLLNVTLYLGMAVSSPRTGLTASPGDGHVRLIRSTQ
jgi:hypothetical protein